ncbi:DUF1697 domain-containing protein [Streptomyces zingiberis]|uniref:DUF1697 domain-containing protein n=1 Tax=Streptomyces zingiberis TaxID=2053010 RepID=A0ABX1BTK1_9ACTN|nr:DUF1697 domain-containing protein [Streptomyces zingiberis]NJQ01035.1 DUF1697 domain-containing protein [Streptomyces zingiberis]
MVTTYAALLRGINVGGARKVPMADLRAVLTGLGYGRVRTLLQSGNAVFTAPDHRDPGRLAAEVERALAEWFGFPVVVVVRTAGELRAVVAANPFPDAGAEPARHTVTFLSGRADPDRLDAVDPALYAPDEYRVADGGRELYGRFPDGLGRSRLTPLLDRRKLGVEATTRNWGTVTKLLALAEE